MRIFLQKYIVEYRNDLNSKIHEHIFTNTEKHYWRRKYRSQIWRKILLQFWKGLNEGLNSYKSELISQQRAWHRVFAISSFLIARMVRIEKSHEIFVPSNRAFNERILLHMHDIAIEDRPRGARPLRDADSHVTQLPCPWQGLVILGRD